jgi:uncharacterized protein (TIGR02996 family)
MNRTERDLLARIRQSPDDDSPRLVYADWLDSKSDPRGEFIRIQCRMVSLPAEATEYSKLQQREQELLSGIGRNWVKALGSRVLYADFSRGFVELVHLRIGKDAKAEIEALYDTPYVSIIRSLTVRDQRITTPTLAALFASALPDRIEDLNFSECKIGSQGMLALTKARLPHLRRLRLYKNPIGDRGAISLAQSASLPNLHYLDLSETRIGNKGIVALSNAHHLRQLSQLDLVGNQIEAEGAKALASAVFPQLTMLALGRNSIHDEGLQAIVHSPHYVLEDLGLYLSCVSDSGISALADSHNSDRLTRLDIRSNLIGDEGTIALAHSHHLSNLRALLINGNETISDAGYIAIARSSRFNQLEELVLGVVSDKAAWEFAHSVHLPRLRVLDVRECDFDRTLITALQKRYPDLVHQ